MITETLISDEVWAEAPEDPQRAFLFIVEAAYRRLRFLEQDEQARGQFNYPQWRTQYIYEIITVAEQLGITDLPSPATAVASTGHMNDFDAQLSRIVTRIKAANRADYKADSVVLSFQSKQDIREHLETLRAKINNSSLSEELRAALHKKIDAVEAELEKNRSGLGPIWRLAGAISLVGATVGTFADLPDALGAVNSVVTLVHEEKAEEVKAQQRMVQPRLENKAPLQITHQPDGRPKRSGKGGKAN